MAKPRLKDEVSEFNIRNIKTLQCCNYESSPCGTCDRCELREQLTVVKTWFPRVGNSTKKEVIIGLVHRVYNAQVLKYISRLLKSATQKDFTYVRNRTKPSFRKDESLLDSDRAVPGIQVETMICETWKWFQNTSNWTKCIFLFNLLNTCDFHIIHLVEIEAESLIESPYPHDAGSTEGYAELFETKNNSSEVLIGIDKSKENYVLNIFDDTEVSVVGTQSPGIGYNNVPNVDPAHFVNSDCSKSLPEVVIHKDFIRLLPVNLSKYVLGMLDQLTLNKCLDVSKNWKVVAEEVLKEFYIYQNLNEEVMLLQGAAAHGCNPIYAKDIDVTVPNIDSNSMQILPGKQDLEPMEKISFRSVYKGFSTRNIIMEERNVFCGAYNVMVVIDKYDPARIVHTNGEKYIALGSKDRHVSLIDMSTGYQVGPSMTGHAGSIKCIYLDEKRNFIISGSYDTSLRMWSTVTRKPMRIFRGHTGTVSCVTVLGNLMASGSKDLTCKVWNLNEKMALKTFNHRHSVTAVALSDELCVSGCEGGKVKVWHLKKEKLIKTLTGHQDEITTIKLDCWHIITGAKDGFVLVWSTQGNFNACLMSLRHPNEVLSLEFQYLRIITASADGKLRIWNMITGQCLRIMRGNSGSDPILQLIAIENRLTVNTSRNVLVMSFESVIFDYSLEDDKVPPLVHFSNYSYAPVRRQTNAYIRRNRMKMSGASNEKIIHHQNFNKSKSYGSINAKNVTKLKTDPQLLQDLLIAPELKTEYGIDDLEMEIEIFERVKETERSLSVSNKSKSEAIIGIQKPLDCMGKKKRRTSWAFETSSKSVASRYSLNDTKALLRSQIRNPDTGIQDDFIDLTVRSMETSNRHTVSDGYGKYQKDILNRPASSPSKLDPRKKIKMTKLSAEAIQWENSTQDSNIYANNATLNRGSIFLEKRRNMELNSQFLDLSVDPKSEMIDEKVSIHIPKKFRPHTANINQRPKFESDKRPKSAVVKREQAFASFPNWKQVIFVKNARPFVQNCNPTHFNGSSLTTSSKEASLVPMLMFSNEK